MLTLLLLPVVQAAEVGGYFRLMARPDLVGGDGRLGTSALYGRLLNEGPWGLLDLRQPLVKGGGDAPWGDLRLRVEGGAVANGEPTNGSLLGFRLSQLHLHMGNVGLPDVEWRVGTLETTFGDLWLYDARPSQMLVDTLGVQAAWTRDGTEVVFGGGDAGWALRGEHYHTVASVGGSVKRSVGDHLQLGLGGQGWYEPADGDADDLRDTPGLRPNDDPVAWAAAHPDAKARPVDGAAWKLVGHIGLSNLGILRSNHLQIVGWSRLPDAPVLAPVGDNEIRLGAASHTDARYELVVGNETELTLVPERWDLAWGVLLDHVVDRDDPRKKSPGNHTAVSSVVRSQVGMTHSLALLLETSLAHEVTRGAKAKDTWQGKGGIALSPAGTGLGARPALRLLYGVQHCSLPNAWPGTPTGGKWHHLVSLEGEAWF